METEKLLQRYQHSIGTGRGGLLFSVMGGRLSEGVNFADKLARAIIVVGMPFPNKKDTELQERIKHYSKINGDSASREYLENLCMRSVNQTVGRAIRHANDYAAIVLLDERYGQGRIRSKLPTWMHPSIQPISGASDFPFAFAKVVQFFRSKKT